MHCEQLAPRATLKHGAREPPTTIRKSSAYKALRWLFRKYKTAPYKGKYSRFTSTPKMPRHETLRIATLNCKGLIAKGDDTKQHLLIHAKKDNKIDMLFLQESHVNANSIEVIKGCTFVYSSDIIDELRKRAEALRNAISAGAQGLGKAREAHADLQRNIDGGIPLSCNQLSCFHGPSCVTDFEQVNCTCVYLYQLCGPPSHYQRLGLCAAKWSNLH